MKVISKSIFYHLKECDEGEIYKAVTETKTEIVISLSIEFVFSNLYGY